MMLWNSYLTDIWNERRRWATWEPDQPIAIGWYGTVKDRIFDRVGDLADRAISYRVETGVQKSSPEYTSSRGVTINEKAVGSVDNKLFPKLTRAELGIQGSFTGQGALVMRAVNSAEEWMQDPMTVRRAILQKLRAGQWRDDWWYIEKRAHAESGFVVMSRSEKAEVEVTGKIKVPGVKAQVEFDIEVKSGAVGKYPMNNGFVPFFTPYRVRLPLWERILHPFRGGWGEPEAPPFGAVGVMGGVLGGATVDEPVSIESLDDDTVDSLFSSDPPSTDEP